MAHLALTDTDGQRFTAVDRFARGTLGLAGAQTTPLRVWVEDWQIAAADDIAGGSGGEGPFAVRLGMGDEQIALDLELVAERPIVPQGERGYSRKGDERTNASAYYSIPRLRTRGAVVVDGQRFEVTGTSWFDREWGTSFLPPGVAGWDWFSLQLDDGRDLMFYRLRRPDGTATRHSAGTLVRRRDAEGGVEVVRLGVDDVRAAPAAWWTSPHSGVRYPVAWTLEVPGQNLELRVTAVLDDQELRLATRYWEGAVDVSGRSGEADVTGRGYLELAGYEAVSR
jgi:predicted secreted hydrolase